jgi:plasmid stabilization system protein ParE
VPEVIWSPQAVSDFQAIRLYISHDSARYADLVAEKLVADEAAESVRRGTTMLGRRVDLEMTP